MKNKAIGILIIFSCFIIGISGCLEPGDEDHSGKVEISEVQKEINCSKIFTLDFLTDCCDIEQVDPFNESELGIQNITWLNDSTVQITAYVSINCAFWIEGGGFNMYNNSITLNYFVGQNYSIDAINGTEYDSYLVANCFCVSYLSYTLSNIESKDYNFTLERYEIKHLVEE